MEKTIRLSDRALTYELARKNVKNINLRISPEGRVRVSASRWVPQRTIDNFIREKEDFILKALEKVSAREERTPLTEEEKAGAREMVMRALNKY